MTHATGREKGRRRKHTPKLPSEKREHTQRGFRIITFTDAYGEECSVQKSSLADQDCIWLGAKCVPKRLVQYEGWKPIDLGPDVSVASRMHLTQKDVAALLPILQHFVKTGELP